MKKWTRVLAAAALVGALFMAVPGTGLSANLTGGTYTYVIQGEEQTFAFDPIVRKDGLLLPLEVFQGFGIKVDNALTKNVTLSKDDLSVTVTLGDTNIDADGTPDTVATPPLRIGGRLFLPADLLRQFGAEYSLDGNYVVIRSYVDNLTAPTDTTDAQFASLKSGRTITGNVKLDSNIYVSSEFTLLNESLINSAKLNLSYGARARLLGLLQGNTLIMVKLSNTSFKSGALVTTGIYLTDSYRNQYDTPTVIDIGQGLISNKVAPGADRFGVLAFPKLSADAAPVSLYYDNNGSNLGSFTNP